MNLQYENEQYWNQRAAGYSEVNKEELNGIQKTTWSTLLRNIICETYPTESPENLRILDIGAGPGFLSIILAKLGYSVLAADHSENMLKEARKNADTCHASLAYACEDAENLSQIDESFHAVICRNLTWNLQSPEKAYREWLRVLKPGGLLLIFDANWYAYLYNPECRAAYENDRRNVAEKDLGDYNIGSGFEKMERMARELPMTRRRRPDWDMEYLRSLGVRRIVKADDIGSVLYSEKEKINYGSTPLFMIKAVKGENLCRN